MKTKSLRTLGITAAFIGFAFASTPAFAEPRLAPVTGTPAGTTKLAAQIAGRILPSGVYQWPGLYFEAKFKGSSVYFSTGPGDLILHTCWSTAILWASS